MPCPISFPVQMDSDIPNSDMLFNMSYPIPDMSLLNALDDEALEQIIQANFHEDFEVLVDPTLGPETTVAIDNNCTEIYWNITLVPRSLRKNHTYVLVSYWGA